MNNRGRAFRPAALTGAALLLLSGCDFGLETVNIDTTRLREVEPQFQLNDVVLSMAPNTQQWRCEASIVQQHLRVFTGVGACANFNVAARNNMTGVWNDTYGRINELGDVIDATSEDPSRSNLLNMARILRAFSAMQVTDTYGAVPYTEAGLAFKEGIVFPAYDSQEFIYTSDGGILQELQSASAALDPSQPAPAEALYGGDITRWKRFGNSLLLRAGMRLSKVAPNLAQQYVQAAVAGGVMQSNDDNARIVHENNYRQPIGATMNSNEGFNEYLPAPFVDYLQDRDDPRLGAIAVRYPTATSLTGQTAANGVTDPDIQIGIPMGYDNNSISEVFDELGVSSVFQFTQTDRRRIHDLVAPSFVVTYAQTQLLLAEAAARGWIPGGSAAAADYYAEGIRADMERISTSYVNTAISDAEIDAFLAAHPLDTSSLESMLRDINSEYWVASQVMPGESWANFRRSCYPAIPPNPLRGDLPSNEGFFRRLLYPEGEIDLNPNYETGATMPDELGTRVWWDVDVAEVDDLGGNRC